MKYFVRILFLIFLNVNLQALAAQKGVVNSDESDIYKDADFDSDIVESVRKGETYLISDKLYGGAFYKIKLKSGKVGYIADHEINVNGKQFEEKPFEDDMVFDKKGKKAKAHNREEDDDSEPFDFYKRGVTVQLINYHEDTMGAIRTDDLLAYGYKSISDVQWEIVGSLTAPKYYSDRTGGSTQGFNLWADYGINNTVSVSRKAAFRYGGSFMGHFSQIKAQTPAKSYDMQDFSLGVVLEAGFMLQFKKITFDLSAKYFFDRNNYGGLGLSLLF